MRVEGGGVYALVVMPGAVTNDNVMHVKPSYLEGELPPDP